MTFFVYLSMVFTILVNMLEHRYYYAAKIYLLFRFSFGCYMKFNFLLMCVIPIVVKNVKHKAKDLKKYQKFQDFLREHKSISMGYSNFRHLMQRDSLHEVVQHSQIFNQFRGQNPNLFYYVSPPDQGYDAITFDLYDFDFIKNNKGISVRDLIEQIEIKMLVRKKILDSRNIRRLHKKYSATLINTNKGFRSSKSDHLIISSAKAEDFKEVEEKCDFSEYNDPIITLLDSSSNFYNYNHDIKKGGVDPYTLFTPEAIDSVKSYLDWVLENSEKFQELDQIFEDNPYFPFILNSITKTLE